VSLERHQEDWELLARVDPLWAIFSLRSKKFGRWDSDEFFANGEARVTLLLERAVALGHPEKRSSVLDFGCGVGRLAPALSTCFENYCGVDISEGMVAGARRFHESRPNCNFVVNTDDTLTQFQDDTFDLIVTLLVLQHLPSRSIIASYLSNFVRVLRPGGLLAFQLPERIPLPEKLLYDARHRLYDQLRRRRVPEDFIYRRLGLFPMTMSFVPEDVVVTLLRAGGGRVLDVERVRGGIAISDRTYYVTKVPDR
jgi:SAM-dependent methyltransferase